MLNPNNLFAKSVNRAESFYDPTELFNQLAQKFINFLAERHEYRLGIRSSLDSMIERLKGRFQNGSSLLETDEYIAVYGDILVIISAIKNVQAEGKFDITNPFSVDDTPILEFRRPHTGESSNQKITFLLLPQHFADALDSSFVKERIILAINDVIETGESELGHSMSFDF